MMLVGGLWGGAQRAETDLISEMLAVRRAETHDARMLFGEHVVSVASIVSEQGAR